MDINNFITWQKIVADKIKYFFKTLTKDIDHNERIFIATAVLCASLERALNDPNFQHDHTTVTPFILNNTLNTLQNFKTFTEGLREKQFQAEAAAAVVAVANANDS